MEQDVRRLYRNLLLGGVVLLALSFVVLKVSQISYLAKNANHLLYVDAELSAANLLLASEASMSNFTWQSSQVEPLKVAQIVKIISQRPSLKVFEALERVAFFQEGQTVLSGTLKNNSEAFAIEALLLAFLQNPNVNDEEKYQILSSMSCFSLSADLPRPSVGQLLQSMVNVDNEVGFIWHPQTIDPMYLSVKIDSMFPFAYIVAGIIALAMMVMLVLVWRELTSLEAKRQTFEFITRQIARGRIGLPEGVPDSNGALQELAYSFDSMSSHIQRLLKVQREMINAISHELRTPIARLRFGLEVVKDDVDSHVHPTIEALEGDVEELNTLVDEVLTYGKLEEGSLVLKFGEINISQIIQAILQNNQTLLSHLTVTVNVAADSGSVMADSHHLHRALQNLILNASKYAVSKVCITFIEDDERWMLDVEDDGPGIAFEDRDKVFIPFQRLDNSRTRASGGYGLGLAIVQRIAFWHGGAVLVDGSQMGGAKFSFIWSRNHHKSSLS